MQGGIGSQGPPQFPSSQGGQFRNQFQRQGQQSSKMQHQLQNITANNTLDHQHDKLNSIGGQGPIMSSGQTGKHFMQDAIEKKIEKFSS